MCKRLGPVQIRRSKYLLLLNTLTAIPGRIQLLLQQLDHTRGKYFKVKCHSGKISEL